MKFNNIFKKSEEKRSFKKLTNDFKMIKGYQPFFSNYTGGMYEMELINSAISQIATHVSKLNPTIVNSGRYKRLNKKLKYRPNKIMNTRQFLEKVANIYLIENNCFIIPLYKNYISNEIIGLYPIRGSVARIVKESGIDYLVYKVNNEEFAIEYEKVGHLRRHYYDEEYKGNSNAALMPTINLIHTQTEGMMEAIKNSAAIRFLGQLSTVLLDTDMAKERKRLVEDNLSKENNGGILLFDNKYKEIKQIESKPFIIDDKQSSLINTNVFDYFHISEEIIQNKASEDQWDSFYEGCIEPIAIEISQCLTNMLFSDEEIEKGSEVILESSKLQFASNSTKLQISTQMFDRGQLTTNQVMDIWNMPHVVDGDKRYIRKEYAEISLLENENNNLDNVMSKETTDKGGDVSEE